MTIPSYFYKVKIQGQLNGATVSWESSFTGDTSPNLIWGQDFVIVTNQAMGGHSAQSPCPGVLTLTPTVLCGSEIMEELEPITLTVGMSYVEPPLPCLANCQEGGGGGDCTTSIDLIAIQGEQYTYDSAFSPDGSLLVVCPVGGDAVEIYSTEDWSLLTTLVPENVIFRVVFSPDGSWLACGNWGRIYLYQTSDWSLQHSFSYSYTNTDHMKFSPDGSLFAAGGSTDYDNHTGWLLLFDTSTWTEISGPVFFSAGVVAFSPDGLRLAVAGLLEEAQDHESLVIYNTSNWLMDSTFGIVSCSSYLLNNGISEMEFSRNGQYLAYGKGATYEPALVVLNSTDASVVFETPAVENSYRGISGIAFNDDLMAVTIDSHGDNSCDNFYVYLLSDWSQVPVIQISVYSDACTFSDDGTMISLANADHQVCVYKVSCC